MSGRKLMRHHLLDTVFGLYGLSGIDGERHTVDLIRQLETIHAGLGGDGVGPVYYVDEVAAAALNLITPRDDSPPAPTGGGVSSVSTLVAAFSSMAASSRMN